MQHPQALYEYSIIHNSNATTSSHYLTLIVKKADFLGS
jgi:hypothetical protein